MLSEKPMATSVEQAEEMVRVCGENGVILGHATMKRFNAYHQKMKELIDTGSIGRLLGVHARYSVWWNPEVPEDTDPNLMLAPSSTFCILFASRDRFCTKLRRYRTNSRNSR